METGKKQMMEKIAHRQFIVRAQVEMMKVKSEQKKREKNT